MRSGFTLIELLVVIAVILILISIAMPNYMAAQVRAKIARMNGEIQTLTVAVTAYCSTYNHYPPHRTPTGEEIAYPDRFVPLTTPIRFLTRLPSRDVFHIEPITGKGGSLEWISWTNFASYPSSHQLYPAQWTHRWLLRSRGPDNVNEPNEVRDCFILFGIAEAPSMLYSPTNGTYSRGDIVRTERVMP